MAARGPKQCNKNAILEGQGKGVKVVSLGLQNHGTLDQYPLYVLFSHSFLINKVCNKKHNEQWVLT